MGILFAAIIVVAALAVGCGDGERAASTPPPSVACAEGRTLEFAFYAYFEPVSFSANPDPDSAVFHQHSGYEADLLTALEAMDGAGLQFNRTPIADWPGIWLLPAQDDFDVAGGGITILDSRTRDGAGNHAVAFTSGHIAFQQSLLVRAGEAERYPAYDALTSDARVGVFAGTTGEARLLQLTGLAGADGALAEGTQVVTASGTLTADGTSAYVITAAMSTANVEGRERLLPPSPSMPELVYFELEAELLEALDDGGIDAVARGAIGNTEAVFSYGSGGRFAVAALDPEIERGGWALSAGEPDLMSCLNDKLDYLTAGQTIGYAEWRADPRVFLDRARRWRP